MAVGIAEINYDPQDVIEVGLNITKSTVLHTSQNIYSRPLVRNGIVKIDERILTEWSSVETLGVVFDDMLTFSDHNISTHPQYSESFGWTQGPLSVQSFATVARQAPPSSNNFHFQFLMLLYCIWKQYLKGDTGMIQILQSTTIRFLYVLRWYDRVSFREEAHWFYAGYWRTAQLKRSLQQKSLDTFGRSFNSWKMSPLHVIHVLLIRGIATEPLVCCYKPYFLHNSGVYY